jgi:hypothetical protein
MILAVARACNWVLFSFFLFVPFAPAATTVEDTPVLQAEQLGKGSVALDGPWQFHLGDNLNWASSSANDATGQAGWSQLTADGPWGEQGHRSYVGYAWYRRHLHLTPAADSSLDFSLYVPPIENVYEVYWNGTLVGGEGKFPPDSAYPYTAGPQIYPLGPARDGVLAFRVWKAPLDSFDNGLQGGFSAPPVVGGAASLADRKTAVAYRWLLRNQYLFAISSLYFVVMVLSLVAWLRDRQQKLLLWMAFFASAPIFVLFLVILPLPLTYRFALGWLQPVHALEDISLWFLLIWLLRLRENRGLVRLATWLAWITLIANVLDGALTMFDWSNPAAMRFEQALDGFFTIFETVPELLPLVIVYLALRKRLNLDRWLVAIFAASSSLIRNFRIAVSQGSRFTHWTLGKTINAPVFTILHNPFTPLMLANTGLLLAVIYGVYRYTKEAAIRQGVMEQEMRSAQEVQQILIPELLPQLAGYSVTSAYIPAQDVGGDFFQVIPGPGGASWLILGDVSGKGLRAAMTVSLIVGMLRALTDYTSDPAEVLVVLNRRLYGRLHGGFVTCLVMLLDASGRCVLASAGHPAPFVNKWEVDLDGALPLGLVPEAVYEQRTVNLQEGDHLVLYTDGLLEARAASGELYSFERLSGLMEQKPNAEQAAKAATDFGQEDDITVLTLTRLAAGETSSTRLKAPVLAPA